MIKLSSPKRVKIIVYISKQIGFVVVFAAAAVTGCSPATATAAAAAVGVYWAFLEHCVGLQIDCSLGSLQTVWFLIGNSIKAELPLLETQKCQTPNV